MKLSRKQRDALRIFLYAMDRNSGFIPERTRRDIDPRTLRSLRQKGLLLGAALAPAAYRRAKAIDKAFRRDRQNLYQSCTRPRRASRRRSPRS